MLNLIGYKNCGYTVYAQYMFEENVGCVLARKEAVCNEFTHAVWSFNDYNNDLSFYWGHYSSTLESANADFFTKIQNG